MIVWFTCLNTSAIPINCVHMYPVWLCQRGTRRSKKSLFFASLPFMFYCIELDAFPKVEPSKIILKICIFTENLCNFVFQELYAYLNNHGWTHKIIFDNIYLPTPDWITDQVYYTLANDIHKLRWIWMIGGNNWQEKITLYRGKWQTGNWLTPWLTSCGVCSRSLQWCLVVRGTLNTPGVSQTSK